VLWLNEQKCAGTRKGRHVRAEWMEKDSKETRDRGNWREKYLQQ